MKYTDYLDKELQELIRNSEQDNLEEIISKVFEVAYRQGERAGWINRDTLHYSEINEVKWLHFNHGANLSEFPKKYEGDEVTYQEINNYMYSRSGLRLPKKSEIESLKLVGSFWEAKDSENWYNFAASCGDVVFPVDKFIWLDAFTNEDTAPVVKFELDYNSSKRRSDNNQIYDAKVKVIFSKMKKDQKAFAHLIFRD